jgi:hypothetical protein
MPNFSKRHYEAIALAMQSARPKRSDYFTNVAYVNACAQWTTTRAALSHTLAADNHLFQRGRFEAACLPGANVRARSQKTCLKT